MNEAKLDRNPWRNNSGCSMLHRPPTGTQISSPHSAHHACDISGRGVLTHIAPTSERPSGLTCSTLNTGHYHYNGHVGVTVTAWYCAPASATLPLIGFCRNELHTMTPMRLERLIAIRT
ncbi:hypothetical protein [Pseudomonas syringae]|uniref:hypothetical protein n=1 Tax=Pseudomonas syringae TaxID=317 RepID=UPI0012ADD981|nr:hypothetical protein [Pseudomonas syringae]